MGDHWLPPGGGSCEAGGGERVTTAKNKICSSAGSFRHLSVPPSSRRKALGLHTSVGVNLTQGIPTKRNLVDRGERFPPGHIDTRKLVFVSGKRARERKA